MDYRHPGLPVSIARISDKAKKRLKSKHPWIFSNELVDKPEVPAGEIVEIQDPGGNRIGSGYYNPHTLIAIRILEFREPFHLQQRIQKALEYREQHCPDRVYRLIYSESDGLPGLIVDRYNQTLVAQILTAGMERFKTEILSSLVDLIHPEHILLRNDSPYRKMEGLSSGMEWAYGEPLDRIVVEMDGLHFHIDLTSGQKTGFFLDQRSNRQILLHLGSAENLLDLYAYSGAWSLYGAKAGISHVKAVESSEEALKLIRENAAANHFQVETVHSDAVQFLRNEYSTQNRYDRIVLDPPAFCKSKKQLAGAIRGYREINVRAMKLLQKNGYLITCSCSQPITPDLFLEILRQAASDSGRILHLREFRLHPPDHPVLLSFPESLYLKCAVLQVN